MNNQDYTWFFIVMSILNTNIGMYNTQKNEIQDKQNKEILDKLDKILEVLNDK